MTTSTWRQRFRVHPAADLLPMVSDAELADIGADILANGLKMPVEVRRLNGKGDLELIEGRNRLEAMQRVGIEPSEADIKEIDLEDDAVVSYIISANIRRRHLTPSQLADIIVALAKIEVEKETGPSGPVSDDAELDEIPPGLERRQSRLGGRGKKNPIKEAALELSKSFPEEVRPSTRTIRRSLAKAEGKKPRQQRIQQYTPKPMPKPRSGETVSGLEAARRIYLDFCTDHAVDLDAEIYLVTGALRELAGKRGTKATA